MPRRAKKNDNIDNHYHEGSDNLELDILCAMVRLWGFSVGDAKCIDFYFYTEQCA